MLFLQFPVKTMIVFSNYSFPKSIPQTDDHEKHIHETGFVYWPFQWRVSHEAPHFQTRFLTLTGPRALCRVHLQNGVSRAQLPGTCMEPAESHSSSRKRLLMSQAKNRQVYCTGNIILICYILTDEKYTTNEHELILFNSHQLANDGSMKGIHPLLTAASSWILLPVPSLPNRCEDVGMLDVYMIHLLHIIGYPYMIWLW